MENERGQGGSLSSDSTKSNISHKIISEDLNNVKEKETCEYVQSASWEKFFVKQHDVLKRNGVINSPRTRVSILSGTDVDVDDNCSIETALSKETLGNKERWKEDKDKVKYLQSSPETNHMKFTVFDLGDYFLDFQNIFEPRNLQELLPVLSL